MGSLLRAEWLRIRRRWDVWINRPGIPALALLAYRRAHIQRQFNVQTSGDVPPGVQQQIAAETAPASPSTRSRFQFPHSIVTMVQGSMPWLVRARLSFRRHSRNEFTWGTIRMWCWIRPGPPPLPLYTTPYPGRLAPADIRLVTVMGALAPVVLRVDPGDPSALSDPRRTRQNR